MLSVLEHLWFLGVGGAALSIGGPLTRRCLDWGAAFQFSQSETGLGLGALTSYLVPSIHSWGQALGCTCSQIWSLSVQGGPASGSLPAYSLFFLRGCCLAPLSASGLSQTSIWGPPDFTLVSGSWVLGSRFIPVRF